MAKPSTGAYLRELREIAGKNQADVAMKVGVDRSLISLAENGYHQLSDKDFRKAEAYLKDAAEKRLARARSIGIGQDTAITAATA